MPLTDSEKALLTHFLNYIDDNLLMRLVGSVTNGRIHASNRQEAFSYVIMHINSPYHLFHLKRVGTSTLLSYLHHLNETISGLATKDEMIRRIYQRWNVKYPSWNTTTSVTSSMSQPPVTPCPNSHSQITPTHSMHMMAVAAAGNSSANHDPLSQMIRTKELMKEMNTLAFNEYIVGFAQTFYELFNSNGAQWLHGFNETHFFSECRLKIMIKGASEDIELEGEGIQQVLSVLSDLKKEHQLFFSPNLTEQGVRSKQDSHGLVSAAVCGTLHQRSGPVGVFEQCFILSQDPFARESYKIQETVLILRSSNAVSSYTQLMLSSGKVNSSSNLAIESNPRHVENSHPILAITDIS